MQHSNMHIYRHIYLCVITVPCKIRPCMLHFH